MKKSLSLLLLTFLGLAASAQRIEVSTGLPGLLGGLSTGNGTSVSNLALLSSSAYAENVYATTLAIKHNNRR